MRRVFDWYARDYVQWAVKHQPYSWGLELVAMVALLGLVRVVVGGGVIFWIITVPLVLILVVWIASVGRSLRRHS